jgi:NhaC family Na+:H+ antiporter
MSGYESQTGVEALDDLLTSGGLTNMMSSIALTMIAMMFGGIMEETGQLRVIVEKLMGLVKGPVGLVAMTEVTCVLSNATMPEQYISIVVPGRMYAGAYEKMGLHPKTLSNALESAGTVTSALIPWNTCGVFIKATLGIATLQYLPYAVFNYTMPIICVVMAAMGLTLANKDGVSFRKAKKLAKAEG